MDIADVRSLASLASLRELHLQGGELESTPKGLEKLVQFESLFLCQQALSGSRPDLQSYPFEFASFEK